MKSESKAEVNHDIITNFLQKLLDIFTPFAKKEANPIKLLELILKEPEENTHEFLGCPAEDMSIHFKVSFKVRLNSELTLIQI